MRRCNPYNSDFGFDIFNCIAILMHIKLDRKIEVVYGRRDVAGRRIAKVEARVPNIHQWYERWESETKRK